jgi:hypothetical protein
MVTGSIGSNVLEIFRYRSGRGVVLSPTKEGGKNILRGFTMKRRKLTNRPLCLGDLILAVSSYSDSQEETVATVANLLASGQVSLMNNGRKVKARVR